MSLKIIDSFLRKTNGNGESYKVQKMISLSIFARGEGLDKPEWMYVLCL